MRHVFFLFSFVSAIDWERVWWWEAGGRKSPSGDPLIDLKEDPDALGNGNGW